MDKSYPSSSSTKNTVTELEKSEIGNAVAELQQKIRNVNKKDVRLFSVSLKDSDLDIILSDFKYPSDIDKKFSELQCPFSWPLPHAGIVPSTMVSILSTVARETEDGEEFSMKNFICDILTVYELYNGGNLGEANKMLINLSRYLESLYGRCDDNFFISMKKPLQHIVLSCKAHLLKASFSDKLPLQAELYSRKVLEILLTIPSYSEMTEAEQAGMYGFKGQAFSEYGYSGFQEALEYAKKAIELAPGQAKWYFLTGKLMGTIRRYTNWNDYVKEEEIKLLERAVELCEKPSYLVTLAAAYIDCTKTIHRNLRVDDAMRKKLHDMNTRAKELFTRCIELNPDCPQLGMLYANGMLKMPKHFVDKDAVERCIKLALQKTPDDLMVHHAAGMCAERLEYDIEKALHHYEIASEYVYGALADFVRLKYTYEKEYDLIGALENMLECSASLPCVHKTLSYIGSYYMFLKRDLMRALNYYGRIMDEDRDSSAITANKPVFLNMKTPVNMYEILCTEVHLELQKDELSDKEKNILKEFLSKLNQIDPRISEKFAHRSSKIQQIVEESVMLTEKYKAVVQKKREQNLYGSGGGNVRGNVRRSSTSRGRGRGYGEARSMRRQSDSSIISIGSWRNADSGESRRRASVVGSWRDKDSDTDVRKLKEINAESEDYADTYQPKKNNFNSGQSVKDYGMSRTYNSECNKNENSVEHKQNGIENKTVQKFQKSRVTQTIREPYGPYEGGVAKSFERKRIPDMKWMKQ